MNSFATHSNQLVDQLLLVVHCGRSLGNDVVRFFDRRKENDFFGDQTFLDHTVRAFEEAVLIGAGIGRQGVDQTDVRTFRCLDRAHTAVVSRVNVSNFKAGALTRQTARAECGNTTLVSDLDSGLFWSMNWESWLEPKNSLTAAATGLALIRS